MKKVNILGTDVNICSRDELLLTAKDALNQTEKSYNFLSINSIKIINAQNDLELRNYIKNADVVYPDAIGLCVGIKILYKINQERIPGYEFHFDVLDLCNKNELSVYVLGAKEKIIDKAMELYKIKYPKINFVGYNNGYFSEDFFINNILKEIKINKPNFIIVAMGGKLQEYYIDLIQKKSKVSLLMGVGGSLDAFIGVAPRAPRWMLKIGFEWLFRLIMQPSRYRSMIPLPIFAFKIIKKKFFG